MRVSVYTAKTELIKDADFTAITLPTPCGYITILDNHSPIIGCLTEGSIQLQKDEEVLRFEVTTGYFECSQNTLTIIIEKTTLTPSRIEEIKDEAIKLKNLKIKEDSIDEQSFIYRQSSEGF